MTLLRMCHYTPFTQCSKYVYGQRDRWTNSSVMSRYYSPKSRNHRRSWVVTSMRLSGPPQFWGIRRLTPLPYNCTPIHQCTTFESLCVRVSSSINCSTQTPLFNSNFQLLLIYPSPQQQSGTKFNSLCFLAAAILTLWQVHPDQHTEFLSLVSKRMCT